MCIYFSVPHLYYYKRPTSIQHQLFHIEPVDDKICSVKQLEIEPRGGIDNMDTSKAGMTWPGSGKIRMMTKGRDEDVSESSHPSQCHFDIFVQFSTTGWLVRGRAVITRFWRSSSAERGLAEDRDTVWLRLQWPGLATLRCGHTPTHTSHRRWTLRYSVNRYCCLLFGLR